MSKFIFLICTERSGSNLITNMMNGHSDISGPSPTHLFRLFGNNFRNYGNLSDDNNWEILVSDFLLNFRYKLGIWNTTVTQDELYSCTTNRSVFDLLQFIYEKEAHFDNSKFIFVKENHTFQFANHLMQHFPNCVFVYLVRDPRDVASSWVTTNTVPGGVKKAIDTWISDQQCSIALYEHLKSSGRIILKQYEDLIANSKRELTDILNILGLRFEKNMLDFYKNIKTKENSKQIDAWLNLGNPVIKNNVGKYKKNLSNEDTKYIELKCGDLMKYFGYMTDYIDTDFQSDNHKIEISKLENSINSGGYEIKNHDEQVIREHRLFAINKVLQRRRD